LTQTYLKEIETKLNAKVQAEKNKWPWENGKWRKSLRSRIINVSMWWKLGDLTGWALRMMGDHVWVRRACFPVMPFVQWMCDPFIFAIDTGLPEARLGHEIEKIARFINLKKSQGMSVSLDNVGDASLSPEEARKYLEFYLQLLKHFAARADVEEINFSLKFSALAYEFDKLADAPGGAPAASEEARAKAREIKASLAKLLMAASEVKGKKVFIRIDMEEYAYKRATLALFKEVVEANPAIVKSADGSLRLGVVIQAYLRDSYKDLDGLRQWGEKNNIRVPVRLVKGAYEKYEKALARQRGETPSPVWDNKESTDAAYERLSEFLLLHRKHFQLAFATHNIRTIAHVMGLAKYYGVGNDEFEIQMLHGMGDPIKEVVASMGYRMRVYVPAGTYARGMKYAGRRFRELASKDNALSRSLRGEYGHLAGPPPRFTGPADAKDGEGVDSLLAAARAAYGTER
jgi:RHH-type proline utilization regulon transcriptional repressor/proline dehydrogenase/delta 1-pyrroline-5-carboxylate dehydrogenase